MEPVVIGSAERALVFAKASGVRAGRIDRLGVAVTGSGLSAHRQVSGLDEFASLAAFFSNLADRWRGWNDERVFESLQGRLVIRATHGGHVNLRVDLGPPVVFDGWTLSAAFRLAAGEALGRAATDVARLLDASA